jgi:ubiquitin-conjugating enzyme E2 D/E
MSFAKRLVIHQREMEKNPPPLCFAEPKDAVKDMTHWIGYVDGPEGTPYAGGRFYLTIEFPLDYPFKPPEIKFITPIYHPNISTKGEICLDILHSQWSPVLSIRSVLISLCSLLNDANHEHGLNKDALSVYQADQNRYNKIAMEWTQKYAINNKHKN